MDRKSKNHLEVLKILRTIFPDVKQEYCININGKRLYIDIYIPSKKIGFEINGQQHYKYNKFMHSGDVGNFTKQRLYDNYKKEFCEENKINLIAIPYNDSISKEYLIKKIGEILNG